MPVRAYDDRVTDIDDAASARGDQAAAARCDVLRRRARASAGWPDRRPTAIAKPKRRRPLRRRRQPSTRPPRSPGEWPSPRPSRSRARPRSSFSVACWPSPRSCWSSPASPAVASGSRCAGAPATISPAVAGSPSRLALALGAVALGQLGLWQYGRTEGGVLGPLDYLGQVYGPLVLVEFAAAGVLAWLAAR